LVSSKLNIENRRPDFAESQVVFGGTAAQSPLTKSKFNDPYSGSGRLYPKTPLIQQPQPIIGENQIPIINEPTFAENNSDAIYVRLVDDIQKLMHEFENKCNDIQQNIRETVEHFLKVKLCIIFLKKYVEH